MQFQSRSLTRWRPSNKLAAGNPKDVAIRNIAINEKLFIMKYMLFRILIESNFEIAF